MTYGTLLLEVGGARLTLLLLRLALLEKGLRDHDLVLGRDAPVGKNVRTQGCYEVISKRRTAAQRHSRLEMGLDLAMTLVDEAAVRHHSSSQPRVRRKACACPQETIPQAEP